MLKRGIVFLFVAIILLLAGCASKNTAETTVPETTQAAETVPETEATEPAPVLELLMTEVTLTTIGEQVTIYSGEIPAHKIYWHSADASVAMVDRGVVTAMGRSGVSNVFGVYEDQILTCTVTSTASYTQDRTPILTPPDYTSVDPSFFDDAVFVGDSISLKLSRYHNGELGNAQFLVQSSYSIYNAINDKMVTTYRGRSYTNIEDAIAASGAKKVFIMLGMNDLGIFGVDQTLEHYRILIELIQEACPDIEIYIQSVTPMWTGSARKSLNNTNIHTFNFILRFFAQEHGCGFIDIGPYLQDYTGGLAAVYSSDRYVHVTENGIAVWTAALRSYGYYGKL